MTNILLVGASRGLGDALNRALPGPGDRIWLVSRSMPFTGSDDGVTRTWLRADLAQLEAGAQIMQALAGERIDVAIYNAGIWEDNAFSATYDALDVSGAETAQVIAVNLTSAITTLSKLRPNLQQSNNAKVILIGSVNGLENSRSPEVAYNASKFGLRGVLHGLREHWRKFRIAVTIVNPGSFGAAGQIPVSDLVATLRYLTALSNDTCVKELDIVAMSDPF